MHDFVFKEIITDDVLKEIIGIGFDKSYAPKACKKFEYKNIKFFSLTTAQANILKQTALSVGADCATHRETITGKIETTDCIVGGSISQLQKISNKLSSQPFGLKTLAQEIDKFIQQKKITKTQIVGILNLTTDSFSDGNQFYDYEKAIRHLNDMIIDGADIIDVGAESTRPFSKNISSDEQLKHLIPILEYINKNNIKIPISIDTRSSIVAEECLKLGASIINDVSGFDNDYKMPEVIASYNAKVIIQHSKGTPENMQINPTYENLLDEIYLSLHKKVNLAKINGIKIENIIIDPGIGFGKTREDNFEIIKRIEELYSLGCPVMLGISRKSFLNITDSDNQDKDIYTTALNTLAINKKVDYIRVHNVKMHKKLLEILNI